MAVQADKVITNASLIVAVEDKHPHSSPDTRKRRLSVARARFLNVLAFWQRKADSLRGKTSGDFGRAFVRSS
jgi:hypothetical protein